MSDPTPIADDLPAMLSGRAKRRRARSTTVLLVVLVLLLGVFIGVVIGRATALLERTPPGPAATPTATAAAGSIPEGFGLPA